MLPDATLHGPYELRFGDSITTRGVYDHGKVGNPRGGYREGPYVDGQ